MQAQSRSQFFTRLALATALLTLGLVVLGAVVRVTDSGLGCGRSWPLCNGSLFPPLDNITAWIEWLHRLFATLIGLFGIGMLIGAIRGYRSRNRLVVQVTVVAAVLFALQAILGGVVVNQELEPTLVAIHLGTAMLLLAALLLSALFSAYMPQVRSPSDGVTNLIYLTSALSFIIILSGALVRGSGATLACTTWPLCNGDVLPTQQGQLAMVHMIHRLAVAGLGIGLALLVWYVIRERPQTTTRRLAAAALSAYLVQAVVGALIVASAAAPVWEAAHVGLAATTWAFLVILSAMEWLNNRQPEQA